MIYIVAPNGLLVSREPPSVTNSICGVGWTSTPSEARQFESPAGSLQWATVHAPRLAPIIEAVIAQPIDAPRRAT